MGKVKVYTKTGDKGQTSLFGGERVPKYHDRVDTYGTVDELNSSLGIVIAHLTPVSTSVGVVLEAVQQDLFNIGSTLATPTKKELAYLADRIQILEKEIDTMTESLPEILTFILPGGGKAGAFLHVSRTICRRTERRLVKLMQTETIEPLLVQYLNRLSDLLFTMARYVNHQEKIKETFWDKKV
ncbi:cob(I)yrinic acid a,c-diamide adenosyltransferase [soil metagenome]